ncbi:MAG: hypothetical protein MUF81_15960 [Verrucomicrobia bacterium]|jgi:hypothetical protein|nr:hypothetical protein [Verrucomicrobiota bacterium]
MNKTIGLQLIVYSLLLAGLSYLVHHLAPTIARPTLITGLAGGGLCLLWGVLALLGSRRKALAILTLIPISYVVLGQAITNWMGRDVELSGQRVVAAITTLLFALSVGMLMRIAYAGAFTSEQAPGKDAERRLESQQLGKAGATPPCGQASMRR